jgi:hypothetical protein
MNNKFLLSCTRLPARLDAEQAGEILGFAPHEISVLISAGLLRPLGKPSQNARKIFCTTELEELSQNRDWLDRATRAVAKRWQERNGKVRCESQLGA